MSCSRKLLIEKLVEPMARRWRFGGGKKTKKKNFRSPSLLFGLFITVDVVVVAAAAAAVVTVVRSTGRGRKVGG